MIEKLLAANNAGQWEPRDDNPDDLNILHWLCSLPKRNDRNGDTIGHVLVLVALAIVHTTMLRMVNVLYDVVGSGPQLLEELLTVEKSGWHANGKPLRRPGQARQRPAGTSAHVAAYDIGHEEAFLRAIYISGWDTR